MGLFARITFVVAVSLAAAGCSRPSTHSNQQSAKNAQNARSPDVSVAGGNGPTAPMPLPAPSHPGGPAYAPAAADDRLFGSPTVLGNLVVYPVTSKAQVDVGPLVSLDDALAKGQAEVRENNGGGTVNQLVIENKGTVPVFVIAGTVVKGGNQDRQIGQDFIIEPKKETPVDAFCVEHGRWNGQRNGQYTSGRFDSSGVVATSKVRAAGQYKKSQSELWSNVSSTTRRS